MWWHRSACRSPAPAAKEMTRRINPPNNPIIFQSELAHELMFTFRGSRCRRPRWTAARPAGPHPPPCTQWTSPCPGSPERRNCRILLARSARRIKDAFQTAKNEGFRIHWMWRAISGRPHLHSPGERARHAARAHDARDLDDVVEADVARVLHVLHLSEQRDEERWSARGYERRGEEGLVSEGSIGKNQNPAAGPPTAARVQ